MYHSKYFFESSYSSKLGRDIHINSSYTGTLSSPFSPSYIDMLVEDTLLGRYEVVHENTQELLDAKMIHTEYTMLKAFFVNGPVYDREHDSVVVRQIKEMQEVN